MQPQKLLLVGIMMVIFLSISRGSLLEVVTEQIVINSSTVNPFQRKLTKSGCHDCAALTCWPRIILFVVLLWIQLDKNRNKKIEPADRPLRSTSA